MEEPYDASAISDQEDEKRKRIMRRKGYDYKKLPEAPLARAKQSKQSAIAEWKNSPEFKEGQGESLERLRRLEKRHEGLFLELRSFERERIALGQPPFRDAGLRPFNSIMVNHPKEVILASTAAETFPSFSKLPPEIRLMIWELAALAADRTITVDIAAPHHCRTKKSFLKGFSVTQMANPLPATFAVSREARDATRKDYITICCPHHRRRMGSHFTFHPQRDTLQFTLPHEAEIGVEPIFDLLRGISEAHNGAKARSLVIGLDYIWLALHYPLIAQRSLLRRFILSLVKLGVREVVFCMPDEFTPLGLREPWHNRMHELRYIKRQLLRGWRHEELAVPFVQRPIVSFE